MAKVLKPLPPPRSREQVKRERIQLLVDALESYQYVQGKNALRSSDNQFCCLGVACDVFLQQTGRGRWTENKSRFEVGSYRFEVGSEHQHNVLPRRVADWFGFEDNNPELLDVRSAASLNDNGWSFREIAALFREKYLQPGQSDKKE